MWWLAPLAISVLLSLSSVSWAATYNAASCAKADIMAAIVASGGADGSIIQVPACTTTWSSGDFVAWENGNLHIRGSGVGVTNITVTDRAFKVTTTTASYANWRISNMTLTSTSGGGTAPLIEVQAAGLTAPAAGWRIDHMRFIKNTGGGDHIVIAGILYGLIDHNTFDWTMDGTMILMQAYRDAEYALFSTVGPLGISVYQLPLDWGTANFVFVEDNTFNCSTGNNAAWDSSAGAARVVFRYNTANGCYFYAHWMRGGDPGSNRAEFGMGVAEVYNNRFLTAVGGWNSYFARLEAGTAVLYNNYVTMNSSTPTVRLDERRCAAAGLESASKPPGQCDGTHPWDGNSGDTSAPGYPCLGQVGRATGKTWAQITSGNYTVSEPVYLWRNGATLSCATGGACSDLSGVYVDSAFCPNYIKGTPHPNGDVEYVLSGTTPKTGYTAYTYPHPLNVEDTPPAGTAGTQQTGLLLFK